MSTLVRTLTERSGAEVRLGSRVDKISRNDSRYELQSSGGNEVVDACVIAAPARSAAGMLGELAPGVAERLSQMTYASSAVINLIYPGGAVTLPPSGSGVLIPRSAGLSILACTWVSSKWPHIAPTDGRSVLRCVIGRVPGDLDATDEQLVERAVADVRSLLTSRADPETSAVHRWERALPQFEVGHLGRLADIEQTIGNLPIRLVGAGYRATGLNDCLAQGAEVARSLFAARD
jgi:oxygen-dependent protoporphyrinogen oxidase